MPLGAFKTALFGAAGGSDDYVWDPIGYVQTSSSTGDGTPTSFQFNNIPGDYRHLVLQMGLRRGSSSGVVKLTLNGTTTNSNYWGRGDYVNNTAQNFYGTNGNQSYFYGGFGGWDGFASIPASVAMHSQWWFLDYADSSCVTTVRSRISYPIDPNSYYSQSLYNGTYNLESAVTSMQIVNTNYFGQPSVLTLYGLRDE
jgi:hypothetical protein